MDAHLHCVRARQPQPHSVRNLIANGGSGKGNEGNPRSRNPPHRRGVGAGVRRQRHGGCECGHFAWHARDRDDDAAALGQLVAWSGGGHATPAAMTVRSVESASVASTPDAPEATLQSVEKGVCMRRVPLALALAALLPVAARADPVTMSVQTSSGGFTQSGAIVTQRTLSLGTITMS